MQSQAACAVMHPQFNLIYLSKLLSLYCEELWERKSQFHRLPCLECFYGLLHTKTSIGIYKRMNNDQSSFLGGKNKSCFFSQSVCSRQYSVRLTYLVHVYISFCRSNPHIYRPCGNKALLVYHLNKRFLHPL